jgi:hypothetical protein
MSAAGGDDDAGLSGMGTTTGLTILTAPIRTMGFIIVPMPINALYSHPEARLQAHTLSRVRRTTFSGTSRSSLHSRHECSLNSRTRGENSGARLISTVPGDTDNRRVAHCRLVAPEQIPPCWIRRPSWAISARAAESRTQTWRPRTLTPALPSAARFRDRLSGFMPR